MTLDLRHQRLTLDYLPSTSHRQPSSLDNYPNQDRKACIDCLEGQ